MKKIVLFIALLLPLMAAAQGVEGKRPVYCDMMAYNFWGIGKVRIILDMGDRKAGQEFETILNENGKQRKFNTMMEALNYMGERGWRVIETYFLAEMKQKVIHYLLEKWITDESERKEGLILEDNKEPLNVKDIEDSYYIPQKKEEKK